MPSLTLEKKRSQKGSLVCKCVISVQITDFSVMSLAMIKFSANYPVNHKNYSFLDCDWFKSSYLPLIHLQKLLSDSYWTVCYRTVQ